MCEDNKLIAACSDYADVDKDISDICSKYSVTAKDLVSVPDCANKDTARALVIAKHARALGHMERAHRHIANVDADCRHGTSVLGKAKALADLDIRWAGILVQELYGDYRIELKDQNRIIADMQKQLAELINNKAK
jgi:hypothetical protein